MADYRVLVSVTLEKVTIENVCEDKTLAIFRGEKHFVSFDYDLDDENRIESMTIYDDKGEDFVETFDYEEIKDEVYIAEISTYMNGERIWVFPECKEGDILWEAVEREWRLMNAS